MRIVQLVKETKMIQCTLSVQALMSMGSFEALSACVFAVLRDYGHHPQCVTVSVYYLFCFSQNNSLQLTMIFATTWCP